MSGSEPASRADADCEYRFPKRHPLPREIANIAQRLEVIDRFEMILQRFAANRDPVLDHHPGFGGSRRVALNRV